MSKLVIFGAGAFAELAHFYFTHDSPHTVTAFTVDGAYLRESTFQGLPVVPFEEVVQHYPPQEHALFVALGIQKVNQIRAAKVAECEARGYCLVSFLSSRAHYWPDLILPPNTMVMEHALLHPFVQIGKNSIIWSHTRLAFHTRIGEHCWLVSPITGESVTVGNYTFIGLNATIAPGVSLGQSNIIGAGALILRDTTDEQIYPGQASAPSHVPSQRLWSFGV